MNRSAMEKQGIWAAIHLLTSDLLQRIQLHEILLRHDPDEPFHLPHPPTKHVVFLWKKKQTEKPITAVH